jgi:hypothetical protein
MRERGESAMRVPKREEAGSMAEVTAQRRRVLAARKKRAEARRVKIPGRGLDERRHKTGVATAKQLRRTRLLQRESRGLRQRPRVHRLMRIKRFQIRWE